MIAALSLGGCGDKSGEHSDDWREIVTATPTKAGPIPTIVPDEIADGKLEGEIRAAMSSGCVIMHNGSAIFGRDTWLAFYEKTQRREEASVRIVLFYTLERDGCTEEYYEAEKNNYPHLFASEVRFDGEKYHVSSLHYDGSGFVLQNQQGYDEPDATWKYLMHYTGVPRQETALFTSYDRYVLVNDDSVTWEDLQRGMFSSTLGDYIPFYEAYCELAWK